MKKIFVSLSTFAEYGEEPLTLLKQSGLEYRISDLGRRIKKEEIADYAKDCNGIVAGVEPYDAGVLDDLPLLECISRCGVGTDSIDHAKAKEKGIVIRNTPDVVIQPVAELTIAMIFDLLRRLSFHTSLLKEKRWEKKAGNLLQGKKAGILGLGRIGKRVAQMLLALGVEVYASDPYPDEAWAQSASVKLVAADNLLKTVDVLCVNAAHSEEDPCFLGGKEISIMKEGAFLINVARGQFVDEGALYDALKNGHLAGAALDVFPQEPYSGKLCDLDNIVLTPHVATLTKESRLQMEVEATQNLINELT